MVAVPQPFEYLHVKGVPEWVGRRSSALETQLATLEMLVPVEQVEAGVTAFMRDILDLIMARVQNGGRHSGAHEHLREFMDPLMTGRRRVVMFATQNRIHLKTTDSLTEPKAVIDQALWDEFAKIESERAIKQIVRLWLDLLFHARSRIHPLDDLLLNPATLLPTQDVEPDLTSTTRVWDELFHELLSWNCCLLPADLAVITKTFFEGVTDRLNHVKWWSLNLLSDRGHILRLMRTRKGRLVIPTGHPDDIDEQMTPHPVGWPSRQLPHSWVIKRLSQLAEEAKMCVKHDGSHYTELALIRSHAEHLLDQLRNTAVPPSAESTLLTVLVQGGTLLYPAFTGTWVAGQLDTIFPTDVQSPD